MSTWGATICWSERLIILVLPFATSWRSSGQRRQQNMLIVISFSNGRIVIKLLWIQEIFICVGALGQLISCMSLIFHVSATLRHEISKNLGRWRLINIQTLFRLVYYIDSLWVLPQLIMWYGWLLGETFGDCITVILVNWLNKAASHIPLIFKRRLKLRISLVLIWGNYSNPFEYGFSQLLFQPAPVLFGSLKALYAPWTIMFKGLICLWLTLHYHNLILIFNRAVYV